MTVKSLREKLLLYPDDAVIVLEKREFGLPVSFYRAKETVSATRVHVNNAYGQDKSGTFLETKSFTVVIK